MPESRGGQRVAQLLLLARVEPGPRRQARSAIQAGPGQHLLDGGEQREVQRDADEDIDALYNSIFRELLTYMMEDPRMIGPCTHLLFGTKNMERIGDHTTNIAENIYFLVHGKTITEERPKKDSTSTTN